MENKRIGLLYILPWLIGLLIFTIYPFVTSLILSFTNYNIINAPKFIGIQNYVNMFHDSTFWTSFTATLEYVVITVPLKLTFSLFIAFILNYKLKGINFYRTAYYVPSILGGNIAIAVLWKFVFANTGLVNQFLGLFGIKPVGWFSTGLGAIFTISALRVWEFGSTMVIFLAGLKDIPQELYEAAAVDGAGKIKTFFKVTIPLLTPIIFFNLVMQLIQAFQEFNGPYMITQGGPLYKTYLLPMMIYDNSFKFFNMGYGSAISWFLFIIIMIFTMFVFSSSKYWVFYSDEGGGES
ncbi:carbohydrate ABC transporter permease [Thermoanaerobacterium thermosaccharolyticum]|uniref:Carbohydrate ABC transporter membrane protein 1, CUT1 family n=1 Tax=Thermoanaerobacterium thermosaccharolyticum M0795 TaxID=698948 RepID=L0IMC7_THETR|nr:sugar ABC transporter permease [Thermoanaerobacterium thermosaccharolyticum]AGB20018.1 carbohydrate ABC transporter membrane protein 1, CUT1 family [Thermoanaerobacterium thermosaccharolyticum M0795]